MRFGYALLVLTTHLLTASCDAAPTATDAKSVKVVGPGPTDDNRSLRVREASNDNNNDADVNDEERTFNLKQFLGLEPSTNLFAKSKLKKMLKDENFKIEMFEKWNQQDLGAGEVAFKTGDALPHAFQEAAHAVYQQGRHNSNGHSSQGAWEEEGYNHRAHYRRCSLL
ncbi:hypothetical protein KRP22_012618 [Phytophthora ramorum]|nr:hypothetical protein KRP22_12984 [Phytophthora ramorum]